MGFRAVRFCARGVAGGFRAEYFAARFCAGFRRNLRPECFAGGFCAGFRRILRPECFADRFCAGMRYLFLRRMEKCSRLRGKKVPNPPEMLRSNVLRGNGVSFFQRRTAGLPVQRLNEVSFSARKENTKFTI